MLEHYDKKRVRVTLNDGTVMSGIADWYGAGYGLHVFDREEESILLGGAHLFRSDIRKLTLLPEVGAVPDGDPRRFDELMGDLIERPYLVADILPEQVPRGAAGQYFAVERWYHQAERLRALRRKFAAVLLRLNCYDDMAVSFDACESWEVNPDPASFAEELEAMEGNHFLRAVFAAQRTMIDVEPDDLCMTVYAPPPDFLDRFRALAQAEGLFVWSPPEQEV